MGTRALIHIKDGRQTLLTLYRQMDGMPTGLGDEIKTVLNNGWVEIINGYSGNDKAPEKFNGMGCLAAFLVGALKLHGYGEICRNPIGSVYIYPANSKDVGEEYTYTLTSKKTKIYLEVKHGEVSIFKGLLKEFKPKEVEESHE